MMIVPRMSRGFVAWALAIAFATPSGTTLAQTIEEVRHQGELRACASLAEAERKSCEDRVRAKISAEWKARIEEQARRRISN